MRTLRMVSAKLLLLLCGGCASGAEEGPTLEPAPLPIYRIGDRFLYDDGSTEEVVAIEGERVTWRRRTGGTFVRYRNLALPKLIWDSPERAGTAQVSAAADALWPLEVGQKAAESKRSDLSKSGNGDSKPQGKPGAGSAPVTSTAVPNKTAER